MYLKDLLDFIDFDYEITDVDTSKLGTADYELAQRRKCFGYPENGSEDDDSLAGPMVALIDKQECYLGDIGSDRFALDKDLVSNIIERTDIYWNDYVRDPVEEVFNKIFDTFEDMYEYLQKTGNKYDCPMEIIQAIIHPESVEIEELSVNK